MWKTLTLIGLSLGLSCVGCASPGEAYIRADRATKDALTLYIDQVVAETPQEKDAIYGLMRSWEIRLEKAEATLK